MPETSFNKIIFRTFFKFCLFILSGMLIASCHTSTQNNVTPSISSVNTSVINVLGGYISFVPLPFVDTCYDTIATQKQRFPDSLSKFKSYGQLLGKVKETKQYLALLYSIPADVQLPVLHTFNTNGDKISTLKLFIGNCCGENEGCSGLSTVVITKDMHIILKDSMQTFERNKKKFNKKKNFRIVKKYEEFKIDSTGTIIKVNSGN
jgi:hypothetical protein